MVCDPDNQKIGSDIFYPVRKDHAAVNGHRVVVKLTDYGNDRKNPEGTVTEILAMRMIRRQIFWRL